MRSLFLMLLTLLLAACAATPSPTRSDPVTAEACTVDADCAVKNVGNCCGYYPQCVNVDYRPNPAAVQAACAREGRSSICGYPEIHGCRCIEGQCAASDAQGSPY